MTQSNSICPGLGLKWGSALEIRSGFRFPWYLYIKEIFIFLWYLFLFIYFSISVCIHSDCKRSVQWTHKEFLIQSSVWFCTFGSLAQKSFNLFLWEFYYLLKNPDYRNSDVNLVRICAFAYISLVYLQYIHINIVWTLWSNSYVFQELKALRSNLIFTAWII